MLHHVTKACTLSEVVATIEQCQAAKAVLEPDAPAVQEESESGSPTGCSRYAGRWYFNTYETGSLDAISEPVCTVAAGKNVFIYFVSSLHSLLRYLF